MEIKITIDDTIYPRVRDALCDNYKFYINKIEGENKATFALRMIKVYLMEMTRRQEIINAGRAARQTAEIIAKEVVID